MGMTTFSGPVRSLAGFITGLDAYVPVASGNVTLTPADNGKTIVIAYTGATIITLPPCTTENLGLQYTVNFSAAAGAGAGTKIMTSTTNANERYIGGVYTAAAGGSATLFVPNGTVDDVVNLNGGSGGTGGAAGSSITFLCTAAVTAAVPTGGRWTVSGNLIAFATPSTPFASS